jgi:hypothetical protein
MPQDVDYFARLTLFEKNSQRDGVFNCLISTLPEVRKHCVGGISEERQTPIGPRRQGPTIIQAPPEATIYFFEQSDDASIPAFERCRELVMIADGGP